MTPQIESYIIAGSVRPFCYRPVGTKKWHLTMHIVGCNVRAMIRERLEPSLGVLEFDMRPQQRPSGISKAAWAAELAHRQRETHPAQGHG